MTSGTPTEARADVAQALRGLPRVVDLLAARAEEHDRDATFPYQGIEAVHEIGLLTLTVGRQYGGPGAGLADVVEVLAELGRGDASVALLTAATLLHHAEQARTGRWPNPAYRRLLTESRRGPALVAQLDATADPLVARTGPSGAARSKSEGGWRLSGRLTRCPGAEALAWLAVGIRTAEPEPRTGTFLIRAESPGLEVDPVGDQLGLRAATSHELRFTEVSVPAELVVDLRPAEDDPVPRPSAQGTPVARSRAEATAWRDLALAAIQLGVGRAARDWLAGHLSRRTTRGGPGAEPQHQAALGELESALIGAEELVAGLARRVDAGDDAALARTGPAHLLVCRAVVDAVRAAVELTGSTGLSRRQPLERQLRDALSGSAHGRPPQTVLEAAGRAALARAQGHA
jgi:alkylation response protein AidB-like acyl-CoA dehydrogenase